MKKRQFLIVTIILAMSLVLSLMLTEAQDDETHLLSDFESGTLFLGKDADGLDIGYVPWGDTAGNVLLEIVPVEGDLALPEQDGNNNILSISYDIATFGGFTDVFTDDTSWTTEDWTAYSSFEFWLYGSDSGAQIQVEIFDNRAEGTIGDTAERWYYRITDDFEGWKHFVIPFTEFQRRTDWQPGGAPNDGLGLNEVNGYAFDFPNAIGANVNYLDNVMVSNAEGNVASVATPEAETETPTDTEITETAKNPDAQILSDFESEALFAGTDANGNGIGYVPWGDTAGNVTLELVPAEGDLALPEQDGDNTVLSVSYDIATFGGFTDVFTDGTSWTTEDWTAYSSFEFWLYGSDSGAQIQVEIFDNRAEDIRGDTAERWYYRITDDFEGWKHFVIPFADFQRRTDWQPDGAPNDGLGLNEVNGYAFDFPSGTGANVNYLDNVMVSNAKGNVPSLATLNYNFDGDWTLFWSDEFDAAKDTPINPDYWTCETGGHGWGNAQLEYDTDRIENVSQSGDGYLVITAREEDYKGNAYTSARCNTNDKVEFMYGKVEARIKLPEGQGIWPAIWMLGADFPTDWLSSEGYWPSVGEIDIMEYVGKEPRSVHGTIHGPGYSGSSGLGARYLFDGPASDDFHVFGIEWEPDVIRWYVDGELFFTATPDSLYKADWVFNRDFFILINLAVGGYWPGNPDKTTVFPQSMQLDWIRVYQRQ